MMMSLKHIKHVAAKFGVTYTKLQKAWANGNNVRNDTVRQACMHLSKEAFKGDNRRRIAARLAQQHLMVRKLHQACRLLGPEWSGSYVEGITKIVVLGPEEDTLLDIEHSSWRDGCGNLVIRHKYILQVNLHELMVARRLLPREIDGEVVLSATEEQPGVFRAICLGGDQDSMQINVKWFC